MTDLRKAAEMALDALHNIDQSNNYDAIEALRQALAQHVDAVNMTQERVDETAKREHEPVAWFIQYEHRHEFLWRKPNELEQKTALEIKPLYTAPPKREWVGLTDEEVEQVCTQTWSFDPFVTAKAIEAKLKEKNT